MLSENNWSWGREIFWGILLFLIFFFLNLFFYDENTVFKNILNLLIAIVVVFASFIALGTTHILTKSIIWSHDLKIWSILAILIIIVLFFVENIPSNIIMSILNYSYFSLKDYFLLLSC